MRIDLELRDIDFSKTVLYWTVEKDNGEDVNHFLYNVQISESINGPWLNVTQESINAFGYVDTITQRGMIDQRIYYRIEAINVNNNNKFYSSPVVSINNEENTIASCIAENEKLLLRRYNGKDALLYARRKFGNRCSACYSDIDRKSIKAKCDKCFGTTYEGGYFAPVSIRIQSNPKTEAIDKNDYQVNEQENLQCWTSNEIIIAPGDLVVTLKNGIKRYEVNAVTPSSLNYYLVKQILSLTTVRADRPEQLLKVDSSLYTVEEFNVFRRAWRQGW